MSNFRETEFVVFDVETTGLSPSSGDRIVEIAALKVKNLRPVTQFHSLIDPQRPISPGAFEVNGITAQMLKGAPKAREVLSSFLQYIQNSVIVGYNAKFDLSFLSYELALGGEKISKDIVVVDALRMARVLLPELGSYPLWYVSQSLGIEQKQEHRAMTDVQITWQVFFRLLEVAESKDIDDIRDLVNLFGIHRGRFEERNRQKLCLIEEAIRLEKKLSLGYFSPRNASTTFRTVTPRRVLKENGNECLVAFCHLRREERSFRVDRILHLEKL